MADIRRRTGHSGFSLVELLVALVFTMVLMAGMASVFKASLATSYTSGEQLSSARRNRMSTDILIDDLNTACMFLTDLSVPPPVSQAVPPFFILPNMPIAGYGTKQDEFYFYMDQPLGFEGKLGAVAPSQSAAELVFYGTAPAPGNDSFTIDCGDAAYAKQVSLGQVFIFKDSWETGYVSAAPTITGSVVTVVAGPAPNALITGLGYTGLPSKAKHLLNAGIVFIQPAQMVRYRIELVNLDPSNAVGIPCLVRDQGSYNAATFTPTQAKQVIAENVSGFKVYLSTNPNLAAADGKPWAGTLASGAPATYAGVASGSVTVGDGWDGGIRAELDAQLAAAGRPDFKTTRMSDHWFRSIPTMVRVDVTSQTATQRSEYSATGTAPAYKTLTQSLVFVPRHAGLTMNSN